MTDAELTLEQFRSLYAYRRVTLPDLEEPYKVTGPDYFGELTRDILYDVLIVPEAKDVEAHLSLLPAVIYSFATGIVDDIVCFFPLTIDIFEQCRKEDAASFEIQLNAIVGNNRGLWRDVINLAIVRILPNDWDGSDVATLCRLKAMIQEMSV